MSQEANYYWDDQVRVTAEVAAFPGASYNIADIIKAEVLTSDSQFLGMDRNTVLPVLGGAAVIMYILASRATGPFYYFISLVAYLGTSVLGFRALRWTKDKRQMYIYTLAIVTPNGTINALSSTDKSSIRPIASAINRAVKARVGKPDGDPPPAIPGTAGAEQAHPATRRRPVPGAKTRPTVRNRRRRLRHAEDHQQGGDQ